MNAAIHVRAVHRDTPPICTVSYRTMLLPKLRGEMNRNRALPFPNSYQRGSHRVAARAMRGSLGTPAGFGRVGGSD